MKFGSLFAGIGGIDLGLERSGMQCSWQVEIDPFCQSVLSKHWPDVKRFSDIKTIENGELENVDVVAGGFPCQPVSRAGKRKAQEDERWLWPEFHRVIRMVRPRIVIVENVTGLFTLGFDDVIADLASSGYDAEWDCLPASAVGASHRRDRVFIVAHTHGETVRNQSIAKCWCRNTTVFGDDGKAWALANASINDGAGESSTLGFAQETKECEPRGIGGRIGPFGKWLPEPPVGRVANGVPARVVRPQLTALGNAVVPQVAELIGRRVMAVAS